MTADHIDPPEQVTIHQLTDPTGRAYSLHPPLVARFAGYDYSGSIPPRNAFYRIQHPAWRYSSYGVPLGSEQDVYDHIARMLWKQWTWGIGLDYSDDSLLAELARRGAPALESEAS